MALVLWHVLGAIGGRSKQGGMEICRVTVCRIGEYFVEYAE